MSALGEFLYRAGINLQKRLLKTRQGNKAQTAYLEWGEPKGIPLVLLHGLGDVKDNHLPMGFFLPKKFRVIIPDLPSFGDDKRDRETTYDLDYFARRLIAFLSELDAGALHLAGHSLGGAVAATIALSRPDLLASLTLIDSAGFYWESIPSFYHHYMRGDNFLLIENRQDFTRLLQKNYHRPPPMPRPLLEYAFRKAKEGRDWHEKLCDDLMGPELTPESRQTIQSLRLNDKVAALDLPTLILWGEEDRLFPVEGAYILHKMIKHSELVVLKKTGHVPMRESVRQFSRAINAFISQKVRP